MFETVRDNLLRIQEEIEPCKPKIIAVTKYFGRDAIISAYEAGVRDFGESRAVEACEKISSLPEEIRQNSTFHFIGHLQTNKVKLVIKTFDYIHSVDSLKLAQCISQHSKEIGKTQKILLQVNNANEEQKFGFSKNTLFEVFQQIVKLDNIEVVGVMNMAPLGEDESELNRLFSDIRQIRDELNRRFGCNLREISMGMSQDYKIAAIQGSTMLRIGRKLFT
jgi:pyridoxal phosphate enzyme (YggS family)